MKKIITIMSRINRKRILLTGQPGKTLLCLVYEGKLWLSISVIFLFAKKMI